MSRATLFGVLASAAWATGAAVLALFKHSEWANMTLNSWGDFFAGAVAPLAFLWLVLGYIQQGEELRLNTEALKAQQRELQRQAEETATLARNSERQANAYEALAQQSKMQADNERLLRKNEAQLKLIFEDSRWKPGKLNMRVRNYGETVRKVTLEGVKGVEVFPKSIDSWRRDQALSLDFVYQDAFPFEFILNYIDEFSDQERKLFKVTSNSALEEVSERSA